jgi:hypothetical protein
VTQHVPRTRATGRAASGIVLVMVYPKQIQWNGKCSGHPARTGRSQRELVAASLLCLPAERVRWDELTRTEYRSVGR